MLAPARHPTRSTWTWPLGLTLVGLLTQARARTPALWAGDGDAAKYAALARGWPDPVLFDGHAYLIHPSGYPASLAGVAALTGLPYPQAASLLGGLCWTALALLTYALGRRALDLSRPAAALAALLLLFSRAGEVLGQGAWREPLTTLGLYIGLSMAWWPHPATQLGRRGVSLLAAGLGLFLGRTWDLFALVAPLWIAGGWRLRRPALSAAGVALALSWGSWTIWRHQTMTTAGRYPAGLDGLWEETADPPPLTWLNPNALPQTSRHNAYFWPAEPTPLRALRPLAPWVASPPAPLLTERRPSRWVVVWAALLAGAALLGLVNLLRDRPRTALGREGLLLSAVCVSGLGLPALIGLQARYGAALWPALALLVARALPRRRGGDGVVAVIAGLATVAWLAGSQAWTWARPQQFEARSAARAVAAVASGSDAVATVVGLSPDLAWHLPDHRVVTLPQDPTVDLAAFLDARGVRVLIVPHEVHPWDRGVDPAWRDEVHGLTTLAALRRLIPRELRHSAVVVEAEACERLRARAYDLLVWRRPGPNLGVVVWPEEVPGLIEALEDGAVSPATRQLLDAFDRAVTDEPLAEPYRRLGEALRHR